MRVGRVTLLTMGFAVLAGCPAAPAQESATPELAIAGARAPIEYEADAVSGTVGERIVLRGNARVLHGETAIAADEIGLDLARRTADATGNVRIWHREDLGFCEGLHYDIDRRETTLFRGRLSQDEYFLTGERMVVQPDRKTLVYGGTITSCTLPVPHYHVGMRDLIVEPGRRFWAHDARYEAMGLPLVWLPYVTRSLRERPFAYIVRAGHSGGLGWFTQNKFHYHHSPYIRPALYVDAFSKAGVGMGVGNSYRGYGGSDNLYGRTAYWWIDQQEDDDDELYVTDRYRGGGYHFSRHPELAGLELTSIYEKLSDNEVVQDYEEIFYGHGWDPEFLEYDRGSFVQARLPDDDWNLRALYKKRLDDFFLSSLPVEEREPQVHGELRRRRLFEDGPFVYATLDYSHARLDKGDALPEGEGLYAVDQYQRGDGFVEIDYPFQVWHWLGVTPFAGYRLTQYTDPETKRPGPAGMMRAEFDDVTRHAGRLGTEFHTRLSQMLAERADGSAARLVYEPLLAVEGVAVNQALDDEDPDYDPLDDPDFWEFPFVDEIDTIRGDLGRLRYRLDWTFQRRSARGAVASPAGVAMSGAYNFHREGRQERMQDLITEGYVQPVSWFRWFAHHRFDHNEGETRSYDTGATLRYPPRQIALTGSYIAVRDDDGINENVHTELAMPIGPKYTFRWTNRYDLDDERWRESRTTLTRDLHDWWLDFYTKYRDREERDDDFTVGFALRFKLPGDTYSGPIFY